MAAPVLLVGHAPDLTDLMRQILEEAGHAVSHVPSGVAAVTHLREHPDRHVVLLSTRPGPDLLDVAEREAAIGRHAFVLVTALWDMLPTEWRAVVQRLHLPVVPKPFRLEELVGTVAQAASALYAEGGL